MQNWTISRSVYTPPTEAELAACDPCLACNAPADACCVDLGYCRSCLDDAYAMDDSDA